MSKDVRGFCNSEGTKIIQSPVNDHRATGCIERTIGCLKNSILIFAREEHPKPLEMMVERALGALWFSPNATLKLKPFEAHHGKEAHTVLQKLTKKRSLSKINWSKILKSKYACLDEQEK